MAKTGAPCLFGGPAVAGMPIKRSHGMAIVSPHFTVSVADAFTVRFFVVIEALMLPLM